MDLRSMKSFERRWEKLKRLAAAQLKDFERDQKVVAKAIRQHRLKNDVARLRETLAHSRRVEQAVKGTRALVARKDTLVKHVKKRGQLLKRALT